MQQASTASQQQLAQSLATNTDNLRYTDYNNQADRWQQGFQNQLAASQNNSQNILGASNALNGASALQAQYNGQLANLGQVYQDYNQGGINQDYNDWYQKNYGYGQQQLANYGNALNSISGNFAGSATTGANPAYKPRTVGGAATSALGGAATGAAIGSVVPGIGTAIGAIGGGIVGAAGYYL
ncbi:MAG TPA: hypothetical protein VM621_10605 [Luteibacter sp.]|uniref:hypothetical protein n=1 Tax=Luteibacter sp. TaxID=1886636 RepID=UPI002CC99A4E|nr:hypothetical protein [Luteibacter sp.]HVI55486.1 hypothetical protein [Luteibacter sp.]